MKHAVVVIDARDNLWHVELMHRDGRSVRGVCEIIEVKLPDGDTWSKCHWHLDPDNRPDESELQGMQEAVKAKLEADNPDAVLTPTGPIQ